MKTLQMLDDLTLDTEPLDPLKDLRKQFLTSDKTVSSQVLLLTGQAGSGKSVFCRRLQRDLLSTWSSTLTQETDDNLWFPIYIDCSLMKEFEADAITKILQSKLSSDRRRHSKYCRLQKHIILHYLIYLSSSTAAIQLYKSY